MKSNSENQFLCVEFINLHFASLEKLIASLESYFALLGRAFAIYGSHFASLGSLFASLGIGFASLGMHFVAKFAVLECFFYTFYKVYSILNLHFVNLIKYIFNIKKIEIDIFQNLLSL